MTTPAPHSDCPPHSKWAQFLRLPEFWTFLVGLLAIIALVGAYCTELALGHTTKANHIWKIVGVHVYGGAAFGVMQGATYPDDLNLYENMAINALLTISIIFIFYTLFSLSCRGLFRIHWLEKQFHTLTSNANTQKKTWVRFGVPGIFLFVLFPLTCTGPLVGAVLGRVIGLGFWTNLITVLSGSLATIVSFAYFADWIKEYVTPQVISFIILATLLLLCVCTLLPKLIRKYSRQ